MGNVTRESKNQIKQKETIDNVKKYPSKKLYYKSKINNIEEKCTQININHLVGIPFMERKFKKLDIEHNCLELSKIKKWAQMINYYHKTEITDRKKYNLSRKHFNIIMLDDLIFEVDAELGLHNYIKEEPKNFAKQIESGIPCQLRWIAWKACTKFPSIYVEGEYEKLKSKEIKSESDTTIKNDTCRTFGNYKLFKIFPKEAQQALYNILKAYLNYTEYTSYYQGMNFIAAFLLIVSDFREEEAFWVFVSLMENENQFDSWKIKGFRQIYSNNFFYLNVMAKVFRNVIYKNNATIIEKFDNLEVTEHLYFSKWIMSIFLCNLPFAFCCKIWDYFLVEGYLFLIKFSLNLINENKEKLLNSNFSQINEIFNNLRYSINYNLLQKNLLNCSDILINEAVFEYFKHSLSQKSKRNKIVNKLY